VSHSIMNGLLGLKLNTRYRHRTSCSHGVQMSRPPHAPHTSFVTVRIA